MTIARGKAGPHKADKKWAEKDAEKKKSRPKAARVQQGGVKRQSME
jgi:hypothetical protein